MRKLSSFAFILICLIYSHRLLCCRLYYLALSKPMHPHHKKTCIKQNIITSISTITSYAFILSPYGGGGEIRTPVQNSFALKGLQQYLYRTSRNITTTTMTPIAKPKSCSMYFLRRLDVTSLLSFLTLSYFKPYTLSFL